MTLRTRRGCMHGWMDGWMDGWMHGCMDAWMHGCTDAWMDGWIDAWIDMDEGMEIFFVCLFWIIMQVCAVCARVACFIHVLHVWPTFTTIFSSVNIAPYSTHIRIDDCPSMLPFYNTPTSPYHAQCHVKISHFRLVHEPLLNVPGTNEITRGSIYPGVARSTF